MKKVVLLMIVAFTVISCQMKLTQGSDKIAVTDLPSNAQIMLKNHFNSGDVLSVERKRSDHSYEVNAEQSDNDQYP